ncbi:hypothetical protein [Protofrankia sp. BMG5.30]|nr:hypothetical protein [Protofrankia sp. BMG5.30]
MAVAPVSVGIRTGTELSVVAPSPNRPALFQPQAYSVPARGRASAPSVPAPGVDATAAAGRSVVPTTASIADRTSSFLRSVGPAGVTPHADITKNSKIDTFCN